jgi:hypothetical protein
VGAVNVIGANITLVDANDLVLGNVTATGNLTICTDGSVEFTGATSVSGNLTVDTDCNNDGQGGTITDTGAGVLTITGTSTLDAAFSNLNSISQGVMVMSTASIAVNETSSGVILDNPLNDFMGTFNIKAMNATIVDVNGIDLGNIVLTDNLDLTAHGAVTNSGALLIFGATNIVATGFDISLNNGTNNFTGLISVAGNNVTINDVDGFDPGPVQITGVLDVNANNVNTGVTVINGTLFVVGTEGRDHIEVQLVKERGVMLIKVKAKFENEVPSLVEI